MLSSTYPQQTGLRPPLYLEADAFPNLLFYLTSVTFPLESRSTFIE